ncbi:helix-turn-helix domain-containing protein [Rhizobium laguerreae]|uniref:helix-turn-helix domain-containing protein n=1 Tax=Rhizobium laguerreae TaxID=1076926 RepID=UPI001C9090DF|nr:helix-turn-helix domain-containing protein [Rhizobium laguerreae]MBY3101225.1 helix-turn-helix domain-containing protein [Rhizobium laguerreae]
MSREPLPSADRSRKPSSRPRPRSPVQFQKRVRLQEARRVLSGANTISAVAYDVGYESISQFNRDYRRLFNLTPSDDAANLRATLKPEAGRSTQQ